MGVHVVQHPIVVDGNIITSQSPATAINVAFTLIEKLTSRANVERIKEGMGFAPSLSIHPECSPLLAHYRPSVPRGFPLSAKSGSS